MTLGVIAVLAGATAPALGGVWAVSPSVALSSEYSSNPDLVPTGQEAGYAGVINAAAPASWDDGARHFEIAPRIRLAAAGGNSAIGADGYYLTTRGALALEKSEYAVAASWADDSAAIHDPLAGTLTRFDVRDHETDLSADWHRRWSDRLESTASATWQSVEWAAALGAGLYDYRDAGATFQLSEALSERMHLQVLATASDFTAPQVIAPEHSYSMQAGIAIEPGPRSTMTLRCGWSRVQSTTVGTQSSGAVYFAGLTRKGLRTNLSASLSQSVQPSGFLTLVRAHEAIARLDQLESERASLYVQLRAVTTTETFQTLTLANRSYQQALLGGSWRVTAVWDFRTELYWQRQEVDATFYSPAVSGTGLGVNFILARRFGRIPVT